MRQRIENLIRYAELGSVKGEIVPLSGGHLHRMWAAETEHGRYAVKLLNPEVMSRPEALGNFIRSEKIARMAAERIPSCTALVIRESPVVQLDGEWMIFPYIDGGCIPNEEITAEMARSIGQILGRLHAMTDLPGDIGETFVCHDWSKYGCSMISADCGTLRCWDGCRARKKYGRNVLSHRDLEPKNVMWQGGKPILIDWEAAGEINAAEDLFTTALCFAKSSQGISEKRFTAFLQGYFTEADPVRFRGTDWYEVSGCFYDLTDWLAYNLTRAGKWETPEERQTGREQAVWAADELKRFDEIRESAAEWVRRFTDPA
ncbi:MAG: aminoglycoside phosphotransferase family protein [Clostridia bacterium]|nr:aminoglycoside phosphotransferase family protein [Clostridia bacterium]